MHCGGCGAVRCGAPPPAPPTQLPAPWKTLLGSKTQPEKRGGWPTQLEKPSWVITRLPGYYPGNTPLDSEGPAHTSGQMESRSAFVVPKQTAPPMETAALRSISADVSHEAALPGPRRSPPALWVPWGHAPPTWRPGGPCRRPHHARFSLALPPGGRRIHPIWPPHDPPTHPRWFWAVPTPPGVPWGHWGGVGHVGAPQRARKCLIVQKQAG